MPHEPKRRHSRGRKGKRRASISLTIAKTITCSNCGGRTLSHIVCQACGYYKGQLIGKQ